MSRALNIHFALPTQVFSFVATETGSKAFRTGAGYTCRICPSLRWKERVFSSSLSRSLVAAPDIFSQSRIHPLEPVGKNNPSVVSRCLFHMFNLQKFTSSSKFSLLTFLLEYFIKNIHVVNKVRTLRQSMSYKLHVWSTSLDKLLRVVSSHAPACSMLNTVQRSAWRQQGPAIGEGEARHARRFGHRMSTEACERCQLEIYADRRLWEKFFLSARKICDNGDRLFAAERVAESASNLKFDKSLAVIPTVQFPWRQTGFNQKSHRRNV